MTTTSPLLPTTLDVVVIGAGAAGISAAVQTITALGVDARVSGGYGET